jgi:hypothetical protein
MIGFPPLLVLTQAILTLVLQLIEKVGVVTWEGMVAALIEMVSENGPQPYLLITLY